MVLPGGWDGIPLSRDDGLDGLPGVDAAHHSTYNGAFLVDTCRFGLSQFLIDILFVSFMSSESSWWRGWIIEIEP